MTTTITVQGGKSYNIPSDKVYQIVSLLEAIQVTQPSQQVREVLTNNPYGDGRALING
jgi:hypothetical protein